MKVLEIIDNLIRKYFGFDKQEIVPHALIKTGNKIILINSESFKRHIYYQKWDRFLSSDCKEISDAAKQKIGQAMGESLAKNLVISFENILIREDK